ncbi:MAG: FAD binding domain-containing protein, partial [Solirubrobacteraceae bacterium]
MQVPAPFQYERAANVEEALELLARLGPEARLLAGGHSLLPMMKLRLAVPEHLIDIDPLAAQLGYINDVGDEVRIGAMTRHRELLESELLAARLPIFADAERVIADPVVRNRGTIGGALCQADPAEDLSAVCAAVGARMVVRGRDGERTVDMHEFHVGPYQTTVGPDEMLVEVRIPLASDSGSAYEKVERRVGDWAVAAAGAAVRIAGGAIAEAGVSL